MENATFDAIKIGIASPDMIRSWSFGEVIEEEFVEDDSLDADYED